MQSLLKVILGDVKDKQNIRKEVVERSEPKRQLRTQIRLVAAVPKMSPRPEKEQTQENGGIGAYLQPHFYREQYATIKDDCDCNRLLSQSGLRNQVCNK